jgi:hypothetical protein
MQPQINESQSVIEPLKKVTPLSKYLAMVLFVILPFLGGLIGYTYAPEKVVEVEMEVVREIEIQRNIEVSDKNSVDINSRFLVGVLDDSGNLTFYGHKKQSTSTDNFVVSAKNIHSWADSENLEINPFEEDTFLDWTAFTNLKTEKGCEIGGCVYPGVVLESRGYEIEPKYLDAVAEFEWVSATEYRYKTSSESDWIAGAVSRVSE